jgi:hypothetical protein
MARADEKRGGGRVRFLENHVAVVVRGTRILADLKNLAKGGARFTIGEVGIEKGDAVTLIVPTPSGAPLKVAARVARLQTRDEERDVAVAFAEMAPSAQDRLQQVVEHMALATRDGQRANPRLATRIQAEVGKDRAPAVVEDLSRGGVVVRLESEVEASAREKLPLVLRDPRTSDGTASPAASCTGARWRRGEAASPSSSCRRRASSAAGSIA